MNILLIGNGGREQAIAWKISQSSRLTKLITTTETNSDNIIKIVKENKIDLVIIGPEKPLADGVSDALQKTGIKVFGPSQAAAEIETSKAFSKEFMQRHNIPTARFAVFTNFDLACEHLETINYPIVIKASGLAAGKGVFLPETITEAKKILREILIEKTFGIAGSEIIIEERLSGPEISLLAFTDGITIKAMLPARDHKRLLDGNQGPNTGGMGVYAPVPDCTAEQIKHWTQIILQPTIDGLRAENRPFVGVLYAGLMLTNDGPKVLEFNARFGDPETQVLLPLLDADLLDIIEACVATRLNNLNITWKNQSAVCVVLASAGYPNHPQTDKAITGLDIKQENVLVFHAATKQQNEKIVTAGGRVLGITAYGNNLATAIQTAYNAIDNIHFDGMQYRRDIGK